MSLALSRPRITSTPTTTGTSPATSSPRANSGGRQTAASHRDPVLDVVRTGCLLTVVVLHALMCGIELSAAGGLQISVALTGSTVFALTTWVVQVMPLFFFIGGCASLMQYRRLQAAGGTWSQFVAARVQRLLTPLLVLVVALGIVFALAGLAGVPPELLAEASLRAGQPLWFLAVYLGLTSLVPLAARLHTTAPRTTLAVLVTGVITVDVLTRTTGMTGLGYLNFVLVWPLVQQLGFVYADMLTTRRQLPAWLSWAVATAALALLAGLVAADVYSLNMIVNLNPPTAALVLLGLVQFAVLARIHAPLRVFLTAPRGRHWMQLSNHATRLGMHVYLWHMPVAITLIAVLAAVIGTGQTGAGSWAAVMVPQLESTGWWATRLPWILILLTTSFALAALLIRVRLPLPGPARWQQRMPARLRAVLAVVTGVAGVVIVLLIGFAPVGWTAAAGILIALSLQLAGTLAESSPMVKASAHSGREHITSVKSTITHP